MLLQEASVPEWDQHIWSKVESLSGKFNIKMKLRNALFKYVQKNTFVIQGWKDTCSAEPIIFKYVFSGYNFYEPQNEIDHATFRIIR